MSLGQIIRNKRREVGLTLDEVSAKTGFSKPYLSTIETGKVKNPPSYELLRKLEEVLQVQPGTFCQTANLDRMPADVRQQFEASKAENERLRKILNTISNEKTKPQEIKKILSENKLQADMQISDTGAGKLIPIINKVRGGYPIDFNDLDYPAGFADDYVRCPDIDDPQAFAARVIGDSMEPKFFEGDIVIFSPALDVRNGDDCFVRMKEPHETTFKRIYFEGNDKLRLQPRNEKYPPIILEASRINGLCRAVVKYQRL